MSCVTNGWQEVSARSMLPSSKRRLIGSRFNKSRQSPRDHNRRLLQQNLPNADIGRALLFDPLRLQFIRAGVDEAVFGIDLLALWRAQERQERLRSCGVRCGL